MGRNQIVINLYLNLRFSIRIAISSHARLYSLFKERSETSQRILITVQDFQTQQLAIFALLEIDLDTAKVQREVNNSMGLDFSSDLIILQEKIQNIRDEIEDRYYQILAEIQLFNPSNYTGDIDERIKDLNNIS